MSIKVFSLTKTIEYSCECALIDVSCFPLIVQTFKTLNPTEVQVLDYIQHFTSMLKDTIGKFVLISVLPDQSWSSLSASLFFGAPTREMEKVYYDRIGLHILVPPKQELTNEILDSSFASPSYALKVIETSYEAAEMMAVRHMGIPFL